jgi:glutaminyl-tRNA synthetase
VLEGCLRDDLDATRAAPHGRDRPAEAGADQPALKATKKRSRSQPPKDEKPSGSAQVPFSRELWIEREDFEEVPPKGFQRLTRAAKCGCAAPASCA